MKVCTKCKHPKPFKMFHRDAQTKDGYKHQCISCRELSTKTYAKRSYRKHKARRAAEYRVKHPLGPRRKPVYRRKIETGLCARCGLEFTYIRVSMARTYCDACRPFKEQHWQETHRERARELSAAREKRDREKVNARKLVQQYIRKGKLERLPCEVCGDPKSQAHHHDYAKPLDVVFLCQKHHLEAHKNDTQDGAQEHIA